MSDRVGMDLHEPRFDVHPAEPGERNWLPKRLGIGLTAVKQSPFTDMVAVSGCAESGSSAVA